MRSVQIKSARVAVSLILGLSLVACGATAPTAADPSLSLETLAQPPALAAGDAACFYEEPNFQGRAYCVKLPSSRQGKTKVADVGSDFNDKFSSLRLRRGLYVMANWDANFCGGYKNLFSDVADLRITPGFSWATGVTVLDNAVSSFVVGYGSGDLRDYCPAGV